MSIYDLPDGDLELAFREAHQWVAERLKSPGVTLSSLAAEVGIQLSALKQFYRRGQDQSLGSLKRGQSFDRIFRASQQASRSLSPDDINPDDVSDAVKRSVYSTIIRMLKISSASMEFADKKVFRSKFICYRKSTNPDKVVASEIGFRKLTKGENLAWEFSHYYQDSDGSDKKSDGPAIVQNNTIYLFGDIQNGEGIDIFLIREPTGQARYLVGFLISIDQQHLPFFSKVVLVRTGQTDWSGQDDDQTLDPEAGIVSTQDLLATGIYGDREFARSLLTQLDIEACTSVLKIENSHLHPLNPRRG